jgi:hypothetical protein
MVFYLSKCYSGIVFTSCPLEQEQPVQDISCEPPASRFIGFIEIYDISIIDELDSLGFSEVCGLQQPYLILAST